jgi:hypothetical protein
MMCKADEYIRRTAFGHLCMAAKVAGMVMCLGKVLPEMLREALEEVIVLSDFQTGAEKAAK